MSILAWVLGSAAVLLLLAVFLWRAGERRRLAGKAYNETKIPAPAEELAEEIAGDLLTLSVPKPKSKPQIPEIPRYYGVDRLVLMVRDPNWLFAYWEITAARQEEFNRQYGPEAWRQSRPVLRVYDVTGVVDFSGSNANKYMDFHISNYDDNWHVEVAQPNSTFCIDLGRVLPDGRFVALLRSNIVHTPSLDVSNLVDEEWMWIEGIYRTITRLHPGSSPTTVEEATRRKGLVPLGVSSTEFGAERNE
ncbi:MAG: DUF4912 domain-containing protein [Firmicutes bacterium]|nr:DUF4912 domain-containing protein [Bacillota bacterium]